MSARFAYANNPALAAEVALHLATHANPRLYQKLLQDTDNILQVFQLPHTRLKQLCESDDIIQTILNPPHKQIEQTLIWAQQTNHHILGHNDPQYPPLLREIAQAPPLLYGIGSLTHLAKPQLAIVGSRKASHQGCELAYQFAQQLSQHYVITSGMALGIDGQAHRGALDNQAPTIAILGCGVNRCYPRRHQPLYQRISHQGIILSEFPLDTPPAANHFPRRNRIISGLSLGVLVVEASQRSGSLITARLALEQNREVFAIPSSIHNPNAKGCHTLIQQGALLADSVETILQELNENPLVVTSAPPYKTPPEDSELTQLIAFIGYDTVSIEQLLQRSHWSSTKLASLLSRLELGGYIKRNELGYSIT